MLIYGTVDMSANRWKYFRWTPRTAWLSFVYMVAVPAAIGYVGWVSDVSLSGFGGREVGRAKRKVLMRFGLAGEI